MRMIVEVEEDTRCPVYGYRNNSRRPPILRCGDLPSLRAWPPPRLVLLMLLPKAAAMFTETNTIAKRQNSCSKFRSADGHMIAIVNRSAKGTTEIGYQNPNGQVVVRKTGLAGIDHDQTVYVLRCEHCGHEYGSNGSDNFQRKCPQCQDGRPGLDYN